MLVFIFLISSSFFFFFFFSRKSFCFSCTMLSFSKKRKKPETPTKTTRLKMHDIDKEIMDCMEQLSIPKSQRSSILKFDKKKKKTMLQQYKIMLESSKSKSNKSGKEWSRSFKNSKKVTLNLLTEFVVIIQDSKAIFTKEFIKASGLKHLCCVCTQKQNDIKFSKQILLTFKALIDSSPDNIKAVLDDAKTISTIVSQVDSTDKRVREISIKLLVTLVIVKNDNLSLLACSKIMGSLSKGRGHRNRWKLIVTNFSVNSHGLISFEYDNYALMLINFVVSSLETVEERTEERNLLNSVNFDKVLNKLQIALANPSQVGRHRRNKSEITQLKYCRSVKTQISAYIQLHKEDIEMLKAEGIINEEIDLSSAKGLFKLLHEQVLQDGCINELTSILKHLLTIPSTGDSIWSNIDRVVSAICMTNQRSNTLIRKDSSYDGLHFKDMKNIWHNERKRLNNESKSATIKRNDLSSKFINDELNLLNEQVSPIDLAPIKNEMLKYEQQQKRLNSGNICMFLPLHKFTAENVCNKIKHWVYNDINYKNHLLRTMKILSKRKM
eukprot:268412_1